MNPPPELVDLVRAELAQPVPPGALALAEELRRDHAKAIRAIVFYGSNLRRGDDSEGILDLYVLVERYRDYYRSPLLAWANAILPPNVFYAETPNGERVVRAKYAVVSLRGFTRHVTRSGFHSYFWGRFAQPCALVYAADAAAREEVAAAAATAIVTFLERTIPLVAPRFRAADLWCRGLTESYRAELRSEPGDAPRQLYEAAPERYAQVTVAALPALSFPTAVEAEAGETWIRADVPAARRRNAVLAWWLRRGQGKILSILRLLKGWATFDGGVRYILWKIERHSGEKIDPAALEGRNRLIALGKVFWRLYRKGAFR